MLKLKTYFDKKLAENLEKQNFTVLKNTLSPFSSLCYHL